MTEARRFALLSWVGRRLGFDLTEVTPADLKPPEPEDTADWYVKKHQDREGFFIDGYDDDDYMEIVMGPFLWEEANEIMHEKNGLKKVVRFIPEKEDITSKKIIDALLGQRQDNP